MHEIKCKYSSIIEIVVLCRLGLVHLLLKALLRYYFLEHLLRIFNAVILQTELLDIHTYIVVANELLLQYVLKEHQNYPDHALLVNLVLVALTVALVHAVPDEQVSEFFRKLHVMTQTIEHLQQARR